ncbi:splicing factor 3B subunit 4, partial [Aplysia californica]|uniref:Splicing factor 3B subunit 4 n=1 Tax=Aplysia californica TaxID=6500 RepID=A0ABM1AEU8_APLCA
MTQRDNRRAGGDHVAYVKGGHPKDTEEKCVNKNSANHTPESNGVPQADDLDFSPASSNSTTTTPPKATPHQSGSPESTFSAEPRQSKPITPSIKVDLDQRLQQQQQQQQQQQPLPRIDNSILASSLQRQEHEQQQQQQQQ